MSPLSSQTNIMFQVFLRKSTEYTEYITKCFYFHSLEQGYLPVERKWNSHSSSFHCDWNDFDSNIFREEVNIAQYEHARRVRFVLFPAKHSFREFGAERTEPKDLAAYTNSTFEMWKKFVDSIHRRDMVKIAENSGVKEIELSVEAQKITEGKPFEERKLLCENIVEVSRRQECSVTLTGQNRRSSQFQRLVVNYTTDHFPLAFESLSIEWIVSSGITAAVILQRLKRRALQYGLSMLPVPYNMMEGQDDVFVPVKDETVTKKCIDALVSKEFHFLPNTYPVGYESILIHLSSLYIVKVQRKGFRWWVNPLAVAELQAIYNSDELSFKLLHKFKQFCVQQNES